MRVPYYTLDEVNRFLVRRWAHRAGVRVGCPAGRRLADGQGGAVILDLDFLPAAVRAAWVRRLLAGEAAGPVLAHGHNIPDAEAAALRATGVRVCRGRVRKAALCRWLDRAAATRAC